jgi:hypothetical protein
MSPEDRPIVVALHGNALKIRNDPRALVRADLGGARLFARFPQDFDLASEALPEKYRQVKVKSTTLKRFVLHLSRVAKAASCQGTSFR